jgi:hypothetical protein
MFTPRMGVNTGADNATGSTGLRIIQGVETNLLKIGKIIGEIPGNFADADTELQKNRSRLCVKRRTINAPVVANSSLKNPVSTTITKLAKIGRCFVIRAMLELVFSTTPLYGVSSRLPIFKSFIDSFLSFLHL